MVELIGDVVIPKELVIPNQAGDGNTLAMSGAMLFESGAELYMTIGSLTKIISGALVV